MPKEYLGDSIYAELTGPGEITLTTENDSSGPSNIIILEREVLDALKEFCERLDDYDY